VEHNNNKDKFEGVDDNYKKCRLVKKSSPLRRRVTILIPFVKTNLYFKN
jgi:hypothetical protein